jgi:hypothetical protein
MQRNIYKLIIKITASVVLVGLTVLSFVLINNYNKPKEDDSQTENIINNEISGSESNNSLEKIEIVYNITIILFDYEKEISNRSYDLNKDQATKKDALFNLLNNNYQIRYETSIYGVTLLDIDSIKTDFRNSYIAIYIDDKYSNFGISSINLYDGMKISLKETRI